MTTIAGLHVDPDDVHCARCLDPACRADYWATRVKYDSWRGITLTREDAVERAKAERAQCERRAEGGE